MRPDCSTVARRRILLSLSIALFLGLFLTACNDNKNVYAPPPPPKVTVQKPIIKDVIRYAYFTGNTSANATVEVRARVKGFLLSTNFQPSAMVKTGDVLFNIDPKEYQAAVDQAKAQLEVKKTQAALELTNYQRQAYLGKKGAVSEFDVLQAKAQSDAAKAEVVAAEAELEAAQIQLDYTQVLAPIDGRINRGQVDTGNLVGSDGNTLLATIVNDNPIYAYFNVSENDLLAYREMSRAAGKASHEDDPDEGAGRVQLQLANEKDFPHKGDIDFMNNEMDPNTGTIQIRGVFTNTDRDLISGFFVRLRVPLGTYKNALLIPEQAIGADQQGNYVYVVDQNNKAQYRTVTLGAKDSGNVVVTKGLKESERIIVQGLQRAKPGQEVTPQDAKPQAAPKAANEEAKPADTQNATTDVTTDTTTASTANTTTDVNSEPTQADQAETNKDPSSDGKGQDTTTEAPAPKTN